MVASAAPLPGTTYAGTRWSTLTYVEKVRPQFLSLRQEVIHVKWRIVRLGIYETFPIVSVLIRKSSQLRAQNSPDFGDQRRQFSERHFASAVLVGMMVPFGFYAPLYPRQRGACSLRLLEDCALGEGTRYGVLPNEAKRPAGLDERE